MDNRERIEELAAKAQRGSRDAFNELYRLTRDRAYFVAFTITRNEQDALDIVQESFLKAWQRIASLEKPERFQAWLRQITGNTAKDYIKHHSPLLFPGDDGDTENLFNLQEERDCGYIPDAAMDTAETRRLIMDIVDELPEDQRLCTLMYYYDELSLSDIAATLDVPEGTVKKRLYLARKKISGGVEALEKKGTKLYGAAPIPLLIWMLRGAAEGTGKAMPPVILGGSTAGVAAFGGALATKVAAGIAAVVMIGGGIAAGVLLSQPTEARPAAETAAVIETTTQDALQLLLPMLPLPEGETHTQSHSAPLSTAQTAQRSAVRPAVANAAETAQTTRENIPEPTKTTTTGYVYTTKAAVPATSTATTTTKTSAAASTNPATESAAETTAAATAATAPQKITRSGSGVTIEFLPGVLPGDVTMEVLPGYWDTTIWHGSVKIDGWCILLDSGGSSVQPSGSVTVRLQIPESFDGDPNELVVWHGINGMIDEMDAHPVNGAMEFTCDGF